MLRPSQALRENVDRVDHPEIDALDRGAIVNIGGFSDAVLHVIGAFLSDNHQRFVAEGEAIDP